MPLYTFKNNDTNEIFDKMMKYSEKETYLSENPHIQSHFNSAPSIGDAIRLGIRKPDDNFRDVLKKAKQAAPKSHNINDF